MHHDSERGVWPVEYPSTGVDAPTKEAMAHTAALLSAARAQFAATTAALLEELDYQVGEFEAGRMPAHPAQRLAPDMDGPMLTGEHTVGVNCPLPPKAPVWQLHECSCGARYRRYPQSVVDGLPERWGRIDV